MKIEEVIKELRKSQNSNKVYRDQYGSLYKLDSNGSLSCFEVDERFFSRMGIVGLEKGIIEAEFTEVPQEVTWQEAIEVWSKGKGVKCIIGKYEYIHIEMTNSIGKAEITEGKWYIL